jgi:two-component system phosphate regulon sensor histidine kinase PhoR
VVNGDAEQIQALVDAASGPVVVLDDERRVVASNVGLAPGRRVGDVDDALVLFVGGLPALSAYEELRAGFTAAVSHELRTPLTRLMVLLESMALPGADVDELLEQARLEIEQARELIDDVLFLGELESGREIVALGSTLALPVVREVEHAYADRALHAEVKVVVTADPSVELPLRPRMLRVVAENLLQNSIRYAGQGRTCRISVEREYDTLLLAVTDDGVGVRASELPRLFERFYRADRARTSRGTGLGLAIVKHVVTAAGGTVDAFSPPGMGLRIVCRFPAT